MADFTEQQVVVLTVIVGEGVRTAWMHAFKTIQAAVECLEQHHDVHLSVSEYQRLSQSEAVEHGDHLISLGLVNVQE